MTDNPKPLEAINAEELLAQSDIKDTATGLPIEQCDCAECKEFCARLRERDAARKVANGYQSQEVKVTLTNTYFVGVHLEDALDAAREEDLK